MFVCHTFSFAFRYYVRPPKRLIVRSYLCPPLQVCPKGPEILVLNNAAKKVLKHAYD